MTSQYTADNATAPVEYDFDPAKPYLFLTENARAPFFAPSIHYWHKEMTASLLPSPAADMDGDHPEPINSPTAFVITSPPPMTAEEFTPPTSVNAMAYGIGENIVSLCDYTVLAGSEYVPNAGLARIATTTVQDATDPRQHFASVWQSEAAIMGLGAVQRSSMLSAVVPTVNASAMGSNFLERKIVRQLDELFDAEKNEYFELGMDSKFSASLQDLCGYDPSSVLVSLKRRITGGGDGRNIMAEAIRWASRQESKVIRHLVLELLYVALHHHSSLVRDSAASGLSYLEEERALLPLREAWLREEVPELKEDLSDLIESLEG